MSRHTTYRGVTIDMDTLGRDNEKSVAIGNMRVNARGDQIDRGRITKTADQIARENHRVQTAVVNTGLKGKQPVAPVPVLEQPKPKAAPTTTAPKPTATSATVRSNPPVKEVELPNGDIVIDDTPTKD